MTADGADEGPTCVRFAVLAMLALLAMTAYLTRACIAAANTTIQRELGLASEQMGDILSAFWIGYLVFQIPGGWLGTRYGNRLALPLFSALSSAAIAWTGLAISAAGLWASRVGLGLAQAGMIPCAAKVISDWYPEARRGAASAVFGSSLSLGAVLASGLTAVLIPVIGWRPVFLLYALLGILWTAGFALWFRDRPEDHPRTNIAEQHLIRGPAPKSDASRGEIPTAEHGQSRSTDRLWLTMLTSSSLWLICAQSFFRSFGYVFFVTWFPAYLEKGYGVQVSGAGAMTMVPLAAVVVGTLVGGGAVDALLSRTGSKWVSRSATSAVALSLCAAATLAAAWARSPLSAVLVISCGAFFSGFGNPAAWAATMDIGGRHTSVVFGVMNTAGVIAGIVCPKVLGHLFAHIERTAGDWNLVLYLFAANYFAGALSWVMLDPERSAVEAHGPNGFHPNDPQCRS